jgi:NAD(P)-dependent dehydrogenase (short-subunit alcohol dehydrogenase family)
MKILVVGATGTIGRAIADKLAADHEVHRASRHGAERVDLGDPGSMEALYEKLAPVEGGEPLDAVVCAAGRAPFAPLEGLSDADFELAIRSKLMGQVNLVRRGLAHVRDGGSFTLTSGLLSRHPVPGSTALAMANGALEAFVKAAALDMPREIRINVVSPGWVSETLERLGRDAQGGTPATELAETYIAALGSEQSGETLLVGQ